MKMELIQLDLDGEAGFFMSLYADWIVTQFRL